MAAYGPDLGVVEPAEQDHVDVLEESEQGQADEGGRHVGHQLATGQQLLGWSRRSPRGRRRRRGPPVPSPGRPMPGRASQWAWAVATTSLMKHPERVAGHPEAAGHQDDDERRADATFDQEVAGQAAGSCGGPGAGRGRR